jgi:tetratricopeptide (TPR) repeat protein
MKRFLLSAIAALFLCFIIIPPANAQGTTPPAERDAVAEQEILDRLAAIEPDAVPFFEAATKAMDSGDLEAAEDGFVRVLDMAPDFPDALRRLSYVEGQMGKVDAAIEHARRAYEMDDAPVNQSSLAWALLLEETPRSNQEALTLAWDASRAEPDDEFNAYVLIVAGMMNEDISAVRRGVETLQRVMPDAPETHFFNAIVQAEDGNFLESEREAERARELGMPSEVVDSLLYDAGVAAEARTQRLTRLALYSVGGWIGALGVLFVAGAVLSGLTMAAVRRARPGEVYQARPGERVVRTLYRNVNLLASV